MSRVAGLLLLLMVGHAGAAQIDRLSVSHVGDRYRMHLDARLDTPLTASYAAFRDFDNLPRINDAVESVAQVDGGPPGALRLHTVVRVCVWFFCKHLNQVQDIRDSQRGDERALTAVVLPALSNLRYGTAAWTMRDCDGHTCLDFSAELEPDFWVPPLIGPWLIERAMRREALATAQGIERIAAAGTTRPGAPTP